MSAPIAFGRRCVVPVLGELALRYPRLAISLELDDRLVDLVGEGLDVAIRIGGLSDSSAMVRKLADNCRILVASPTYLDAAGPPATPEAAAGHTFLRYGSSTEPWHLKGLGGATARLAATGRLRVDDGDAVHDWGLAGLGIMLKSQVDVAADLSAERLERVLPGWDGGAAPIVVLYPSGRNLPLKTRVLRKHSVKAALCLYCFALDTGAGARWRYIGAVSGPMTNSLHVVVAGTRRVWSPEQKRAILAEVDDPGTTASEVARQHGLHSSLLFRWRRALLVEQQASAAAARRPSSRSPCRPRPRRPPRCRLGPA